MPKRAYITALGCKANWVDSEDLRFFLSSHGCEISENYIDVDLCILNTCTVTAASDSQSRQLLRKLKKHNPHAIIIANGCGVSVNAHMYDALSEVDCIFRTDQQEELHAYLNDMFTHCADVVYQRSCNQSRARAFYRIQDGCNMACAYCIIPKARGRSRSKKIQLILDDCRQLSKMHNEIVLTGTDIAQYSDDVHHSFLDVVDALLNDAQIRARFRLSSLSPQYIDDRLIDLLQHSRICNHVHISMQSACNKLLDRMNRPYTVDTIDHVIDQLIAHTPNISIATDIIVGFPSETDDDFQKTYEQLKQWPLAHMHVFPYSARQSTAAADMPNQIPIQIRKLRTRQLIQLSHEKKMAFLHTQMGKKCHAIVVGRDIDQEGCINAFTDNAISAKLPANVVQYGEIGMCNIESIINNEVYGQWTCHRMNEKK